MSFKMLFFVLFAVWVSNADRRGVYFSVFIHISYLLTREAIFIGKSLIVLSVSMLKLPLYTFQISMNAPVIIVKMGPPV